MGELEFLYSVGGNIKWCCHCDVWSLMNPQKFKHRISICLSSSIQFTTENWKQVFKQMLFSAHCSASSLPINPPSYLVLGTKPQALVDVLLLSYILTQHYLK